ncbi:MAG: hypothetical protein H5T45_03610 [Thermoplasmatales archaeon]|nr:hypothetical protein [Thermoplasmatales archaeon]
MSEVLKWILNDYCDKVLPSLFKNSVSVSAKKENIVSYPTHIINAVFTASSIYSYEHLDTESENNIKELKLLISIITLHDIGKYLEGKYGISGGNSKENIKKYFENDDFKIKDFFPEIDSVDCNEIAWLIQNTELKDETRMETSEHRTEFGRLADYSRLGDKIASLTKDELYVLKIFDALKYHDVHVVQIPKFPQFLIRKELLKALKKYYEEKGAIPFLLFEDGIFYIHKEIILPEPEKIKEHLLTNIKELLKLNRNEEEQENFLSLRIDFQSIDDSSILNFPLPIDEKKEIILSEIIRKIPKAMKGVNIALPQNRELQKKLAVITYFIYKNDDIKTILKKQPNKKEERKINDILNTQLREKIKSIRDQVGSQKFKIYVAKELFENYQMYDIESIFKKCDDFLNQQLEQRSNLNIFDTIIKNISVDFQQTFDTEETPKDKEEMCFLCGTRATLEYRAKMNYFLQAREFSKRGKVFGEQKKICPLCLIERNLIEGLLSKHGYSPTGDYLFAIFYFDKIFANISYFARNFSNVPIETEISITERVQFRLGDFDGLYLVVPYRYGGKEEAVRQSNRVNITKQILDFVRRYGCKSILTVPYTLLRTYNTLFVNENPTRLEISLQIHTICDFGELAKKRQFLNAIYELDKRKGYFSVQSYNIFSFIHFTKLKSNDWNRNINVVKSCFWGEMMKIEEIAQRGKELYSNVWGSSYKRTVLMRTAIDAILIALQQRLPEDELKTFVSAQIYKLAMREEYAKKKDAEKYVKEFVESLIHYLKEKNWYSVSSLSSIEKYLVDAYEFALKSISKEA